MLPFNVPFEVCEIILNYLRPEDLLNCCLVSKSWLKFYNESNCRRKVTILINEYIHPTDLHNFTRNFVKIKFNKLKGSALTDSLQYFASTIEEMELQNCEIDNKEFILNFPRLICLSISNCSATILRQTFKNKCPNLRSLVLYKLYGPSTNHVLNFLKTNHTLEEINFYLDETNNFFSTDISNDINIRLKSLFISYRNYDLTAKALANIEKFLKLQGDTLETISLINCTTLELLFRIWNDLKSVKQLYCFWSESIFHYNVVPELKINLTIVDLELHSLGPFSLNINHLFPILSRCPNLRSLGVWYLTKELVDYAARNSFNLRAISCARMEIECVSYYNELKSKIGINDKKIQINQYL